MPRTARIVVPHVAYHITQRGNRREDVFFSDGDRNTFLKYLLHYAAKHALSIRAYCLMTNHIHLVAVPETEQSLANALKPVHLRYAQHVNWTQRLTGRLWQGRFFSCALEEDHYWRAVRYVERNPVRAGMVARAADYPWSSAAAHCGLRRDPLVPDAATEAATMGDWAEWLSQSDDPAELETLRRHTRTGRPLGGSVFLDLLETVLGRTVRPGKAGRPRKATGDGDAKRA